MKERLKHIFGESACITRRQLKDYLGGQMLPEECHAIEHHLNDCPFCSAALDGMLEHTSDALEAVGTLNTEFLKDHFGLTNPQVHLNSMAPTAEVNQIKKKSSTQPLWKTLPLAAAVLLGVGLLWYMKYSANEGAKNIEIAQQKEVTPVKKLGVQSSDAAVEPSAGKSEQIALAEENEPSVVDAVKQEIAAAQGQATDDMSSKHLVASNEKNKDAQPPAVVSKKVETSTLAETISERKEEDVKQYKVIAPTEKAREADVVKATDKPDKNDEQPKRANAKPAAAVNAVPNTDAVASRTSEAASELPTDKLERGNYYFQHQNWKAAIKEYNTDINNVESNARRHEALFMSAKCYLSLGNKAEATRRLQIIIEDGGSQKRHAKKLLEEISKKE